MNDHADMPSGLSEMPSGLFEMLRGVLDVLSGLREVLSDRVARGLTQRQLADRCESNEPFISNLERGVKVPSLSMLIRLAQALQCSMCTLVEVFDRSA